MLVLSRQRDETIMIGDDIEITIVDIRGDKVRLGITAPSTVPVHRKEVYDAIQRENREASRVKMEDLGSLPKNMGKPSSVPPGLHRPAVRPGMPGREPPAPPQNGTASSVTPQNGTVPPPSPADGAQPGSLSA